jgi:hypothetical protein
VTCAKLHHIPYRWIVLGVSHAFLTKPQKNGSTARVLWGTNGRCDNLFFLRNERRGALSNIKSLALKFRSNGVVDFIYVFCFFVREMLLLTIFGFWINLTYFTQIHT